MEGEDGGVDTEKGVSTQHLNIPVIEVKHVVQSYGLGVHKDLVVGNTWDCEVRQGGNAEGGGLGYWSSSCTLSSC